ncbi:MAG: hypothetical protein ACOX9E_13110 [Lentisphaeria bacterium]|jgi:hypothetical protein
MENGNGFLQLRSDGITVIALQGCLRRGQRGYLFGIAEYYHYHGKASA